MSLKSTRNQIRDKMKKEGITWEQIATITGKKPQNFSSRLNTIKKIETLRKFKDEIFEAIKKIKSGD